MTYWDEDEILRCEYCTGGLSYLGALGNRQHYRCTCCGMDCSFLNDQPDGPLAEEMSDEQHDLSV